VQAHQRVVAVWQPHLSQQAENVSRPGRGGAGRGGARQGRAGQGRAGQGRAGQGRAGQGRAGPGRAGQGRGVCREGWTVGGRRVDRGWEVVTARLGEGCVRPPQP
jgi:hypothetical protein